MFFVITVLFCCVLSTVYAAIRVNRFEPRIIDLEKKVAVLRRQNAKLKKALKCSDSDEEADGEDLGDSDEKTEYRFHK